MQEIEEIFKRKGKEVNFSIKDKNELCNSMLLAILTDKYSLEEILTVFIYMGDIITNLLKINPLSENNLNFMDLLIVKLSALNHNQLMFAFLQKYIKILCYSPLANISYASACHHLYKYEEANYHYNIGLSITLNSQNAKFEKMRELALYKLSILHMGIGNHETAINYALKGHELFPDTICFISILGACYVLTKQFQLGKERLNQELILSNPDNKESISNAYSNLSVCCDREYDYEKSEEYLYLSLEYNPQNYNALQSKLMIMLFNKVDYEDRFSILEEHKRCASLLKKTLSYETYHKSDKINIGFVSGDFTISHPVYIFLKTFLNNHNKEIFNVTCYSENVSTLDNLNMKIIKGIRTEDVCNMIYNDKISILVDLSGFTSGNRLDVFKNKPAPIQITYCGYPATTGLEEMDYRITDIITEVDENIAQQYHTEKLLFLENCFLCYDPFCSPQLVENVPEDYLILGCFNRTNKITSYTTNILINILNSVNNVKIAFNSPHYRNERLKAKFIERFPEEIRSRIFFISSEGKSVNEHLLTYNQINVHIDTNPYSGTTTSCDALTMGVPTLTIYDTKTCFHVTNVTSSILKNSDLDYFVCSNQDELIGKIRELSSQPKSFWSNFKQYIKSKFYSGNVTNKEKHLKNISKLFVDVYNSKFNPQISSEQLYFNYMSKNWNVDWSLIGTKRELICAIVEPRNHENLFNVISNIAYFTKYYRIFWFHSEENKDCLNDKLPIDKITKIKISESNITISEYNDILTSSSFWSNFDSDRVLIFQTDCAMVRTGIEDFMKYDLIGAPWIQGWTKRSYPADLICGNGGFSIRNPKLMAYICNNHSPNYNKFPEDYFFSANVKDLSIVIPKIMIPQSIEEASFFASETILNAKSLGIHAAYKYHKYEDLLKLLN